MYSNHQYHKILAEFFNHSKLGLRKIKEIPWQLSESGQWDKLFEMYADLNFFHLAWNSDRFETKTYWTTIETKEAFKIVDAYKSIINNPSEKHIGFHRDIIEILTESGHVDKLLPILEFRVQYFRKEQDRFQLTWCLADYATALKDTGKLEPALTAFREQEQLALLAGYQHEYCSALGNQAAILMLQSNLDIALTLLKKLEDYCRTINDHYNLCISLNNQSLIQRLMGNDTESLKLLEEYEKIATHVNKELVDVSVFNLGVHYYDKGNYDKAKHNFESALHEFSLVGNKLRMAFAYGNLALVAWRKEEHDEALKLLQKQESFYSQNNEHSELVFLCNKALLLKDFNSHEKAIQILQKVEDISRKNVSIEGICKSIMYQAYFDIIENGMTRKSKAMLAEANDLATTQNLLLFKKEINDISNMSQLASAKRPEIHAWIRPIILIPNLSFSRAPVIIPNVLPDVIPDWSIVNEHEIELYLKNGSDPNLRDRDGGTLLMKAVSMKSESLVKDLIKLRVFLNAADNDGVTALMIAAKIGSLNIVKLLLEAKADLNIQKNDGTTALIAAVSICNMDIVKMLLHHGADPNLKMKSGITPLILAVNNCHTEIVNDLLAKGADPKIRMVDGRSVIDIAKEKCPKLINLLLK